MYKTRYILGQIVKYEGQIYRIIGIRFTIDGIKYKLKGIQGWITEGELTK